LPGLHARQGAMLDTKPHLTNFNRRMSIRSVPVYSQAGRLRHD
jgi:hypothetical protein